jgi:hypothetical protein
MLLFQTSQFLTSSKQRNTYTGWQERETDHRNSLNEDKDINSLSSEKCTGSLKGKATNAYYLIVSEIGTLSPVKASFRNTSNCGIP